MNNARVTEDANLSREELAWKMAREYAKQKMTTLYPDPENHPVEEAKIAHQQYRILMFGHP